MNHTFATAINCIDGRVLAPVESWMRENLNVDYVDQVTEPGPDRILTEAPAEVLAGIRDKVSISVEKHASEVIAVVGHYDCAGNPVSEAEHREQIRRSVDVIAEWDLPVRIIGLWVNRKWEVEKIRSTRST